MRVLQSFIRQPQEHKTILKLSLECETLCTFLPEEVHSWPLLSRLAQVWVVEEGGGVAKIWLRYALEKVIENKENALVPKFPANSG